jgi:hypothetical protein
MLKYIARFFKILSPLLQRLGICATAGFIAGAIAGFILWLYALINGAPVSFSSAEIVQLSLVLALFGWIMLVFAFVVLCRVPFSSMWYSAFFNAFVTSLLTLLVVYHINLWVIAWLVGMIIGIWVGLILCYLNKLLKKNNV